MHMEPPKEEATTITLGPKSRQAQYTPIADAGARVITIEWIVELREDFNLEEYLDHLREVGSAGVVNDVIVRESYDEACEILNKRARL